MTAPTYRQLDHWARLGHLQPDGKPGSGHRREWPARELRIADTIARLRAVGFELPTAAAIARLGPYGSFVLAEGITLEVTP